MENYPDYETVEYHLVYAELVEAARQHSTVTYGQLAQIVGLLPRGDNMSRRTGALSGAVSKNEVNHQRPMLSALVVKKSTGRPGPGFFRLARDIGLLKSEDPQQETAFWEEQKQKVYETWKQKSPQSKE